MTYVVIDAPSVLGLWPSGVEKLPDALKAHGLVARLGATIGATISALPYSAERDEETGLLNGPAIRRHAQDLATALDPVWQRGEVPLVLGGDCSILVGAALGLKRRGRHALLFIDGHADYYGPMESPSGEVADMDFAVVTGAGHPLIGDIEQLAPYFAPCDTVAVGARDHKDWTTDGSQDIRKSGTTLLDLPRLRDEGLNRTIEAARATLRQPGIEGIWVHFDADALDDEIMPAVDYRLEGGLSIEEATAFLHLARDSGCLRGVSVTIFNPMLDPDGTIAGRLADCLVEGLGLGETR